jgi:arylamine N-acetyltransferase
MKIQPPLSDFVQVYYRRLELDPCQLDPKPTSDKLSDIVEAHIFHIPYENIAQYTSSDGNSLHTLQFEPTIERYITIEVDFVSN